MDVRPWPYQPLSIALLEAANAQGFDVAELSITDKGDGTARIVLIAQITP